jgi:hypothetical protein
MLAENKKDRITTPFRGAVRRLLGQRYGTGADDRALTPISELIEPSASTPDTLARPPARRRRLPGPYPDGQTPDARAGRFLELLQESGITGDILFEDIFALYHKLLPTIGWAPRPWNPVARELKKLLGGKKTYVWFEGDDGAAHRLRVYRLPRDRSSTQTLVSEELAGPAMVRAA